MLNNHRNTTNILLPINKNYKINEKIGSGAYGEVYKGIREDDGLHVAMKRVILTDGENFNNIPLSTHRELNVLRRLNKLGNDNIVRLFDIVLNKVDNKMCIDIVFELSDYDLESYLKKFNLGGDMPISKVTDLGQQLMDGVHCMHVNRILHRDLKPANILIDRQGKNLKITDFGLARVLGFDAALTPTAVTLWYRSPEILFKNSYSTACDVWSVGCIIGEMVYGRALFAAEDEVKQMEKIVCRLGYEAIDNWPEESFIDSSSFVEIIDPARSLDRVLRRADSNLRGLIKSMLRFDQDHRLLSNEALAKLNELLLMSKTNNNNNNRNSIAKIEFNPPQSLETQDFMVVDSVVRIALDDDDDDDYEDEDDDESDLLPLAAETDHEYRVLELDSSRSVSHESDTEDRFHEGDDDEEDGDSAATKSLKDPADVGDSFGSYRSKNNDSFSSYAQSSQTGTESPDEEPPLNSSRIHPSDDNDDLHRFNEGFIISSSTTTTDDDDSDTCQARCNIPVQTIYISDDEDTVVNGITAEENVLSPSLLDQEPNQYDNPHSQEICSHISPFLIPIDGSDNDSRTSELTRQESIPLHEINTAATINEANHTPLKTSEASTRKRIILLDDSEESGNECENLSPCQPRPNLARHKSLRRRLSVVGPHVSSDRRPVSRHASVLLCQPIKEHEALANSSFGEHSLSRALNQIDATDSPLRLSDRPKVVVRRRSQLK